MARSLQRPQRHALLLAAAAGAALVAAPLPPATPDAEASVTAPTVSRFDQRLMRDINSARASRGIRRLALVAGTTDVAHRWSCHMAHYGVLLHNPALARALSLHGSHAWTTYGENIGRQWR